MKIRYIVDIRKDNISYCKKLLKVVELRHLSGIKGCFAIRDTEYLAADNVRNVATKTSNQIIHTDLEGIVEQQQYFFDTLWNKALPAHRRIKEIEEGVDREIMDVIQNREAAEILLVSEIEHGRTEVLVALSSINYLEHLDRIGFVDKLEQAKSHGASVLMLCPDEPNVENNKYDNKTVDLLSEIKKYANVRNVSGAIKGSIVIVDNSRVLAISEEGIDALAIYSNNKSLVNNFYSLFYALWDEKEILSSLVKAQSRLVESNAQLAAANEQLETNDKLQKEFINIAAHELKTPITPIVMLTSLVEPSNTGNGKVSLTKEDFEIIVRNAGRLKGLTEDILDVTRIEGHLLKLNKERFDINDEIKNALGDIKAQISKHEVRLVFERIEPIFVEADRARIFQVLSNLLGNAVKFTSQGTITIAIEKSNNQDNNEMIVVVKDTGIGIDPEILPRLFTKFATTSEYPGGSGTGLGLFISKGIIEAHGGRVRGENNKGGKGATFSFSLPLTSGQIMEGEKRQDA